MSQDIADTYEIMFVMIRKVSSMQARLAEALVGDPDPHAGCVAPTRAAQRRANVHGQFTVNKCQVHLGAAYRNEPITTFVTGNHLIVYHDGTLLGELTLQEGQRYARLNPTTQDQ